MPRIPDDFICFTRHWGVHCQEQLEAFRGSVFGGQVQSTETFTVNNICFCPEFYKAAHSGDMSRVNGG